MNTTNKQLLNQKEAAEYLGTTVGTLNSLRHYGKNTIPFVRWGNRIRYRKEDLDAWIIAHREGGQNAENS
ncbi:MAG: helix-turn-helix domain-containing protein [Rickettsiales bacterium]|jgi:excisionase family DNA binding protein|nr:helix-turn-helix domain-containing protein [Rickettsiales bacterium]